MSPRHRLSRLAVATAGIFLLIASPAPSFAQLGDLPTSPGFRMTVTRGPNGAPVAGGPAVEESSPAAFVAEAKSGGAKAAEKSSGASMPAKPVIAAKAVAEKAQASRAGAAAKEPADMAASADPLDVLRQKLADRLGARPAPNGKFTMQVSTRGESGENIITAVRPTAAAVAHAHRAAAHRAAASASMSNDAEANANIAVHGGLSMLPTHWDYDGPGGPEAWGRLSPENARCMSGKRQSPIDIRGGIAVDLEPIGFDYKPSPFSVVDNGHTVQVNVGPGNAITITGRRYELVQFHFHRPSEERIDGRQHDMVVHLVHKDAQGHLAVVAVLLDRGSAQAVVQAVWNNLPLEKGDEVKAGTTIDLAQLLPQDRRYYTYMGSLTTPPCSEGVLWMVLKQPVPISAQQESIFAQLYPMNARPVQQADGRLIKESN